MLKEEYAKMFQEEQSHWFFVSKRNFVKIYLEKVALENNPLILDAGCGTGANHLFLQNYGRVVSVDLSEDALEFCRQRSLRYLIRGDLNSIMFKNCAFDLVVSLDMLYHSWVKDDVAVLKEFHRILKPQGKLLITDSAFDFLISRHDKAVMTRQRYTISDLSRKLQDAGFKVRKASYMFSSTFAILAIVRLAQKLDKSEEEKSNLFPVPRLINNILLKALDCEAALLRHARLPFGSSLIVLAEKTSE